MDARFLTVGDCIIMKGKSYKIASIEHVGKGESLRIKVKTNGGTFTFRPNEKVIID